MFLCGKGATIFRGFFPKCDRSSRNTNEIGKGLLAQTQLDASFLYEFVRLD